MENQTHAQNQRVPVIQVSGLKKQYKLGQIGGGTLTHDLQSWWARVRGKEDPNTVIGTDARLFGKTFMALNGVDLTVYKGEALGIIGRNGAGKSTLLKILSRITAPTEGEIRLRGRVASMLEVGTGFNNEMTGRENIYMNGAILGMTRAEVDSKIDQIIEFSECGDFIEEKRYTLSVEIMTDSYLDGKLVDELSLPERCAIINVHRDGKNLVPTGTRLIPGDQVQIEMDSQDIEKLYEPLVSMANIY